MTAKILLPSTRPAHVTDTTDQKKTYSKNTVIGYLVPDFPGQTHAFFWGEVGAIEEAGATVKLYSTRRPPSNTCPHAFASEAIRRTTYLFPPAIGSSLVRILLHPVRTIRAIGYIAKLRETPIGQRLKLIALVPSASMLVEDARRSGVRHLHIHSCANAAHLGALAQILGNLPYSLTLHGDLTVYGVDHLAKMKGATFVAAVTRPLALQIKEVSPDIEAPVIWMGVDCDRFVPTTRPKNAIFTVTTIARLNHMKGHRFFLQAMALLREKGIFLNYRIVGDGAEKKAIEAEIARLGLQAQVQMLGALDEVKVLELLGQVDALALTSIGKGEAAPVAVMEAMSCGLPVICSYIGGTPDMINDGVNGFLVKQEDIEDIAKKLEQLVTNSELSMRMGQAARITAVDQFERYSNAIKLLNRIAAQ